MTATKMRQNLATLHFLDINRLKTVVSVNSCHKVKVISATLTCWRYYQYEKRLFSCLSPINPQFSMIFEERRQILQLQNLQVKTDIKLKIYCINCDGAKNKKQSDIQFSRLIAF